MFDFSALSTTGMKVVFIKADGSERTMFCTTNFDMIPSESHPTGNGKPENPTVKRVFDLEKNAWRSFRIDSVISAEPYEYKKD